MITECETPHLDINDINWNSCLRESVNITDLINIYLCFNQLEYIGNWDAWFIMLFNCYFENPVIVSRISIIFFILKLKKYFKFVFSNDCNLQEASMWKLVWPWSKICFIHQNTVDIFYFTLNSKGSKLIQSCTEDKTHLGGLIWSILLIELKVLHFFLIAYKCFLFKDHLKILNNFNTRRI